MKWYKVHSDFFQATYYFGIYYCEALKTLNEMRRKWAYSGDRFKMSVVE